MPQAIKPNDKLKKLAEAILGVSPKKSKKKSKIEERLAAQDNSYQR
jgi:hypothetical protein